MEEADHSLSGIPNVMRARRGGGASSGFDEGSGALFAHSTDVFVSAI